MITIAEAAARLGISQRTLQILCKARRVPGAKLMGRLWYLPNDFTITPATRGPKASYR